MYPRHYPMYINTVIFMYTYRSYSVTINVYFESNYKNIHHLSIQKVYAQLHKIVH